VYGKAFDPAGHELPDAVDGARQAGQAADAGERFDRRPAVRLIIAPHVAQHPETAGVPRRVGGAVQPAEIG